MKLHLKIKCHYSLCAPAPYFSLKPHKRCFPLRIISHSGLELVNGGQCLLTNQAGEMIGEGLREIAPLRACRRSVRMSSQGGIG